MAARSPNMLHSCRLGPDGHPSFPYVSPLFAQTFNVSHDLREPLRAVNGFSQALVEDWGASLPAEAHKYLDAIRDGGLRMERLLDELLAFSRLGRQPLRRRSIDVNDLVTTCVAELINAGNDKAQVHIEDLLPCEADLALARQVFLNLLGNAFKYSRKREPPRIAVTSHRDDHGQVFYCVRDNGTGFDMKYANKLFQVFQRLHRPAEFEGTGVGLTIVHRIVTGHGGRVWAEAAPEAGASFTFTLGG
jgi:light-regulated signal transduction histidine kinase (bacteriophytochrome)